MNGTQPSVQIVSRWVTALKYSVFLDLVLGTAPVPVKQPWRICINLWHGSTAPDNITTPNEAQQSHVYPDSKFHGANMGPIWGRQDPGGPHVGPMNFVICICSMGYSACLFKRLITWDIAVYDPNILLATLATIWYQYLTQLTAYWCFDFKHLQTWNFVFVIAIKVSSQLFHISAWVCNRLINYITYIFTYVLNFIITGV